MLVADRFQHRVGSDPILVRNQSLAEQPGRLHRHADSFRDNRVSLSRGIAGEENARLRTSSEAGSDWTHRQPAKTATRFVQYLFRTQRRAANVVQNYFIHRCSRVGLPQLLKYAAPNTARETKSVLARVYHSAVPARKDQQRHKVSRELNVREMRLEREQIRITRRGLLFPPAKEGADRK